METSTERNEVADWFNPMAGWEAATRWNQATFDWMAQGWQQWVALVTTMPPHWVVPREGEPARASTASRGQGNEVLARAMAREEPKRPAKRAPRKKTTRKAASRR